MKTKSTYILKILHIIAWVVFLGLCIKAGALLYSFWVSMHLNEIAAKNLYMGLNLFELKAVDDLAYQTLVLSIVAIIIAQALLFYTVIQIFRKINFISPFDESISKLIKKMAFCSLIIGLISVFSIAYSEQISNSGMQYPHLSEHIGQGNTFLFFSGILYFIYQLFLRGIELQKENDLTL
jgi:hypothetical protein